MCMMKKSAIFLFFFFMFTGSFLFAQEKKLLLEPEMKTAFLMIDIQEFYFDEAKSPLEKRFEASNNAKLLLDKARSLGITVIHVQHKGGGAIRDLLLPLSDEKVITKTKVNAFIATDLESFLKEKEIEQVIVCGMMTHMCVEGTVRAAADLGYRIVLAEDACATRDLIFNSVVVKAAEVHASTLQSLSFGSYAIVSTTKELIEVMN